MSEGAVRVALHRALKIRRPAARKDDRLKTEDLISAPGRRYLATAQGFDPASARAAIGARAVAGRILPCSGGQGQILPQAMASFAGAENTGALFGAGRIGFGGGGGIGAPGRVAKRHRLCCWGAALAGGFGGVCAVSLRVTVRPGWAQTLALPDLWGVPVVDSRACPAASGCGALGAVLWGHAKHGQA